MKIRRAEIKDIERIQDLLWQVCLIHHNGRPDLFRHGARKYSVSQLEDIIKDDQRPVLVAADDDDRLAGYAFCIFRQTSGDNILHDIKTLYIDDLCVDEDLRGRHIGRRLYDAVIGYARDHGCYNVTLNVWSCNVPAMRFYESCGLKPQKVMLEKIL